MGVSAKHIAFLELSIGAWNRDVDETTLIDPDKQLILNNPVVIAYYPEDNSPVGPPAGYKDDNTVTNWDEYYKDAGQDEIDLRYALRNLLDNAVGATETDRLNQFTYKERDILVKKGANSDADTGVNFYLSEEGFDQTTAESFYSKIRIRLYDSLAKSCEARHQDRAGYMTVALMFYSEVDALSINEHIDHNSYDDGILQQNPISLINNYTRLGVLGTQWGDSIYGLLDYFHGHSELEYNLSDVPLLEGQTYEDARDALTDYFFTRWTP